MLWNKQRLTSSWLICLASCSSCCWLSSCLLLSSASRCSSSASSRWMYSSLARRSASSWACRSFSSWGYKAIEYLCLASLLLSNFYHLSLVGRGSFRGPVINGVLSMQFTIYFKNIRYLTLLTSSSYSLRSSPGWHTLGVAICTVAKESTKERSQLQLYNSTCISIEHTTEKINLMLKLQKKELE